MPTSVPDVARKRYGGKRLQFKYVDSYVVRLNLQGLDAEDIKTLKEDLELAPDGPGLPGGMKADGKKIRDELGVRAERRARSATPEYKRFINVGRGRLGELVTGITLFDPLEDGTPSPFTSWWLERGWEVNIEPAPMLLATCRGNTVLPMAWSPGSLAAQLKDEFEEAAAAALEQNADASDEIAALPLSLSGKPKWNSHSCRRGGAKRARDTAKVSGAEPEDINRHFGWMEEALRGGKKRAAAYAATLSVLRRLAVTLYW